MKTTRKTTTKKPAPASPPMIRLRLPSEKPTWEDADKNGCIFIIYEGNYEGKKDAMAWPWNKPSEGDEIAWFSLPEGILPREPSQEEKWRKDFEEWWKDCGHSDNRSIIADAAWRGFLAAKKGGAE